MIDNTYEGRPGGGRADDTTIGLGEAIGWDEDVSISAGPSLLEEGDATYEIVGVTKSRYGGSEKLAPSPMAILDLDVCDSEGEVAPIERRVILNSKLIWQIADLMRSAGLLAEDERQIPRGLWGELQGAKGVCVLKTSTSERGTSYSRVDRFLHGDEAKAALEKLGRTL